MSRRKKCLELMLVISMVFSIQGCFFIGSVHAWWNQAYPVGSQITRTRGPGLYVFTESCKYSTSTASKTYTPTYGTHSFLADSSLRVICDSSFAAEVGWLFDESLEIPFNSFDDVAFKKENSIVYKLWWILKDHEFENAIDDSGNPIFFGTDPTWQDQDVLDPQEPFIIIKNSYLGGTREKEIARYRNYQSIGEITGKFLLARRYIEFLCGTSYADNSLGRDIQWTNQQNIPYFEQLNVKTPVSLRSSPEEQRFSFNPLTGVPEAGYIKAQDICLAACIDALSFLNNKAEDGITPAPKYEIASIILGSMVHYIQDQANPAHVVYSNRRYSDPTANQWSKMILGKTGQRENENHKLYSVDNSNELMRDVDLAFEIDKYVALKVGWDDGSIGGRWDENGGPDWVTYIDPSSFIGNGGFILKPIPPSEALELMAEQTFKGPNYLEPDKRGQYRSRLEACSLVTGNYLYDAIPDEDGNFLFYHMKRMMPKLPNGDDNPYYDPIKIGYTEAICESYDVGPTDSNEEHYQMMWEETQKRIDELIKYSIYYGACALLFVMTLAQCEKSAKSSIVQAASGSPINFGSSPVLASRSEVQKILESYTAEQVPFGAVDYLESKGFYLPGMGRTVVANFYITAGLLPVFESLLLLGVANAFKADDDKILGS